MSTFNIIMLIGWIFQLASWFPKKWFIETDQTRTATNLILSSIGLGFFLAAGIILLGQK